MQAWPSVAFGVVLAASLATACTIENRSLQVGPAGGAAGAGQQPQTGGVSATGGAGGTTGGVSGLAGGAGGRVEGTAGEVSVGGPEGGAGGAAGASPCPDHENVSDEDGTCLIAASADDPMTEDLTITAGVEWELDGTVFVGEDVVTVNAADTVELILEPGARLTAGEEEALVINRGSRLVADGTASDPIVFTSENEVGTRDAGDWAGIVINGRAEGHDGVDVVDTVGSSYGGTMDDHDAGVLRFVRIEFCGETNAAGAEHPALTLAGVGTGTVIDHLQIHACEGDGVRLLGGTAELRHVVVNDVEGNSIAWSYGYRGKLQYAVVRQISDARNGIKGANDPVTYDTLPRSTPTLANVTVIGAETSRHGILLTQGSDGVVYNSYVLHPDGTYYCLAAKDSVNASELADVFVAMVDQCKTPLDESRTNLPLTDRLLRDIANLGQPDFRPVNGSPLLTGAVAIDDEFFDQVEFVGAMGSEDFTSGWTAYPAD